VVSEEFRKGAKGFYLPSALPFQNEEDRVSRPEFPEEFYESRSSGRFFRKQVEYISLELEAGDQKSAEDSQNERPEQQGSRTRKGKSGDPGKYTISVRAHILLLLIIRHFW
jgi:hypothetical protein